MNKKVFLGPLLLLLTFLGCSRLLSHEEYIRCRQEIFKELHRPSKPTIGYDEPPSEYYIKRLLYPTEGARYALEFRELRNRVKDAAVKGCNSLGYSFRWFDISHKLYGRYNLRYSEELMVLDPRPFEIKRARQIVVQYPDATAELMLDGEITLKIEKNGNLSLDGFPVTMAELPGLLQGYTPTDVPDVRKVYGKAASLPEIVLDVDSGILCSELWPVLALLRDQGKEHVLINDESYNWSREIVLVQPDTGLTSIPKGNFLALTLRPRPEDNDRQIERIIQLLEPSEDLDIYAGSRFMNWCIIWRVDDVCFDEIVRAMEHIGSSVAGNQYVFLFPPDEYNEFKRSGRTTEPEAIPAHYRWMVQAHEAGESVY